MKLILGEKRDTGFGKWSRTVTIDRETDGVENLKVSVIHQRGKYVRIPYKPRGQNRGYQWWGSVYENGRCLWHGRVQKSHGARGILKKAELI